jgi:putative MFS transporter
MPRALEPILLLWLPDALVGEGISVDVASAILAKSSLIALPLMGLCTYLYSRWSTKWSLTLMIGIMTLGLLTVLSRGAHISALSSPVVSTTLLIIGSTGAISMLLPYTAECYPLRIRGRASGWIAGCSKLGGLGAQGLAIFAGIPPLGTASLVIALPASAAIALIARFGGETRGRDLRTLEAAEEKRPAAASTAAAE